MKNTHTPGPWAAWPDAESNQLAVGPATGGGVAVCDVVNVNAIGISTVESRSLGEANSRLIAAAPELLEACKAIDSAYGVQPLSERASAVGEAWKKVGAAISKAEGNA